MKPQEFKPELVRTEPWGIISRSEKPKPDYTSELSASRVESKNHVEEDEQKIAELRR